MMNHKLVVLVNIIVLISQIPIKVNGVTLNAALLTANGYSTTSTYVTLGFKNIDSIDPNAFNGYTQLTILSLFFNNLGQIDFGVIPASQNLFSVDFGYNPITQITNVNNATYTSVWALYLSNVRITSLDTNLIKSTFPNLASLFLTSYQLDKLQPNQLDAFTSDPRFRQLSINVNNQQSLSAAHFSGVANTITWITFSSSNITSIDDDTFVALSKLDYLDLSNNSLSTFANLTIPNSIGSLILRSNKLSNLNVVASNSSNTLVKLFQLDLSYNRFTSFASINFSLMPKLQSLTLSNNPLTNPNQIFSQIQSAVSLNNLLLDQLGITSVASDAFQNLTDLRMITLNFNPINSIAPGVFSMLPNLTSVLISSTNLLDIGDMFSGRTKLNLVDLSYNKISQLSTTAFANLTSLENLNLNSNRITSLSSTVFSGSNNLKYILIGNNQISSIAPGTFNNLTNLNTVYLSYNRLTTLDVNIFAGCTNLRYIYLSGNSIPASILQSLCPNPLCQVY